MEPIGRKSYPETGGTPENEGLAAADDREI